MSLNILYLCVLTAWMVEPAMAEPSPQALVIEALDQSPDLESMRASQRALQARAEVARAMDDPVMMVEYSNAPVSTLTLEHPMAGLQLKIQQVLRAPGTARLKKEIALLEATASEHLTAEAELQLARAVRETWWLLTRTRQHRAVTEQHLARTEELLGAARARYETGSLGQHGVLRLEVLRDTLGDELDDATRLERELLVGLARATGGQRSEVPTPTSTEPLPLPSGAKDPSRPALEGHQTRADAAEKAAQLARADAVPDLTVWAGYRLRTVQTDTDPGTDLVSLGIGVPIPTGSTRKSAGARASALDQAAAHRARQQAERDAIDADLEVALARWERALTKARTYDETLIPGARATLRTTQADFTVGRADFASLFEAEVALLQLERARIGAAVETHIQHARVEAILGTPALGETP